MRLTRLQHPTAGLLIRIQTARTPSVLWIDDDVATDWIDALREQLCGPFRRYVVLEPGYLDWSLNRHEAATMIAQLVELLPMAPETQTVDARQTCVEQVA